MRCKALQNYFFQFLEGEDDGDGEEDDEDAFSPPYTPLQLPTRAQ